MAGHPQFQENGKEFCRSNLIGDRTMSDMIIAVENLSKRYLVGHQSAPHGRYRYTALRDVIGREARNFCRKTVDFVRGRQIVQGDEVEEFWALRDVNFEVKRGEVLGIIGRNGAGKSTLLKILSRITEPDRGRAILRGRVASLLEVGTGFHPELTGRENIYLNGAILGMTRAEIARKFDEIVAFAEVERFLDTPVKRYSSGMYVRLAFAVAAHLEAGDSYRRRGPGGWRYGIPEEVPDQDARRGIEGRPHHTLRQSQHGCHRKHVRFSHTNGGRTIHYARRYIIRRAEISARHEPGQRNVA